MKRKKRRKQKSLRATYPKRRDAPGSLPGTITPDPNAPAPNMVMVAYDADAIVEQTLTQIPATETLPAEGVVWINVVGLGDAALLEQCGRALGLHALALEDVVHTHQRPKAEEYDDHLFVILRVPGGETGQTQQAALFLQANLVITFQEQGESLEPVKERIRKGKGQIRRSGADYLAYAIIDTVIDHYYPVIESYGDDIERLEQRFVADNALLSISTLHQLQHSLLALHRVLRPYREMVGNLLRSEDNGFGASTRLYLRDCQDHIQQLTESVDAYRALATHLLDSQIATLGMRTNEIMRALTVIATIFIPLTFIAGVYGMNFDPASSPWNMPEIKWYWGYPAVMGLMSTAALGLSLFVWRRGWLSRSDLLSRDDGDRS